MFPSIDLLRRLGSGVRPGGGSRVGATPFHARSFDELLQDLHAGGVRSGRPVRVADGLEILPGDAAMVEIGVALDAAESAGVGELVAVSGRHAFRVKVTERLIDRGVEADRLGVLLGVEAVVVVDAQEVVEGAVEGPRALRGEIVVNDDGVWDRSGTRRASVPSGSVPANASMRDLLMSLDRELGTQEDDGGRKSA